MSLSVQQLLEIKEIREGVVVLKDNSVRGVLMVSSLNFALKSEDEQGAIIYQFQNFLNSLDFSSQIIVQSRRLNITGYLDELENMKKKQKNELLKIQIEEYRKFISGILSQGIIMTKNFFVVVPFTLIRLPEIGKKRKKGSPGLREEDFQRAKTQLLQRIEFVASGLGGCGLLATPLNTSELIELFWSLYHPDEAENGYYPEIPPELIR